jgi:hypothetical protein
MKVIITITKRIAYNFVKKKKREIILSKVAKLIGFFGIIHLFYEIEMLYGARNIHANDTQFMGSSCIIISKYLKVKVKAIQSISYGSYLFIVLHRHYCRTVNHFSL